MANEPITIRLQATAALTDSGALGLTRDSFSQEAGGRILSANVSGGSRITSDIFQLFSPAGVKSVAVSSTSKHPHDVARVYSGSSVRDERTLRDGPQTLYLGAGEQLAFVTTGATIVSFTVNELSEGEHAALDFSRGPGRVHVRLVQVGGSGFSVVGVANPNINGWDATSRVLTGSTGAGTIPLASLLTGEIRFNGARVRVRVSGFDGTAASVGTSDPTNNETHFIADIGTSEWSPWIDVAPTDRIAIQSPAIRVGASALVADIELAPVVPGDCCIIPAGAGSSTSTSNTQLVQGGVVPVGEYENMSVNAAGGRLAPSGWEMFTTAVTTNAAGGFVGGGTGNKSLLTTDFALLNRPLNVLQSLRIAYQNRRPAETSILGSPYVNFMVDLLGDGTDIRVFVLDQFPSNSVLNLLNKASVGSTAPEDQEFTLTWIGGGRVKVVNLLAGVTPVEDEGASWLEKVYAIGNVGDAAGTSILAEYPNAKFTHAYPADGGLPADLCLRATTLVLGDSNWTKYAHVLIRELNING